MRLTLATLFLLVTITSAQAASQWTRIGPGPSLEYAKAYCDKASMGVGTGMYLITQSRFFINCMTMHGWKKMRVQSGKVAQTETKIYRKRSAREVLGTKCYGAKSMADMLKHC